LCASGPLRQSFVLVFGVPRKNPVKPRYTNILDYPSNMSLYERDSLVAEAKLGAEKKAEATQT